MESSEEPLSAVQRVKGELRERARRDRDALPLGSRRVADSSIARKVLQLPEFQAADAVLCYRSFASEVDTSLIAERAWFARTPFALPRVSPATHELSWYAVRRGESLERGPWGIMQPPDDPRHLIDSKGFRRPVAILPGLLYDRGGFRLGYGGGCYDRFLADFDGVSIGLARSNQVVEDLGALGAIGARDLPVTIVVSDREVLRHRRG